MFNIALWGLEMGCQVPTHASHNQKRQIRLWHCDSIIDSFCNIYKLQVKCNMRKSMCDDGSSIYLKVFPCTNLEAIYLVGCGVEITLGSTSQAVLPSDSGRSPLLTLRLTAYLYQHLDTGTLAQKPVCMLESLRNFLEYSYHIAMLFLTSNRF